MYILLIHETRQHQSVPEHERQRDLRFSRDLETPTKEDTSTAESHLKIDTRIEHRFTNQSGSDFCVRVTRHVQYLSVGGFRSTQTSRLPGVQRCVFLAARIARHSESRSNALIA